MLTRLIAHCAIDIEIESSADVQFDAFHEWIPLANHHPMHSTSFSHSLSLFLSLSLSFCLCNLCQRSTSFAGPSTTSPTLHAKSRSECNGFYLRLVWWRWWWFLVLPPDFTCCLFLLWRKSKRKLIVLPALAKAGCLSFHWMLNDARWFEVYLDVQCVSGFVGVCVCVSWIWNSHRNYLTKNLMCKLSRKIHWKFHAIEIS